MFRSALGAVCAFGNIKIDHSTFTDNAATSGNGNNVDFNSRLIESSLAAGGAVDPATGSFRSWEPWTRVVMERVAR